MKALYHSKSQGEKKVLPLHSLLIVPQTIDTHPTMLAQPEIGEEELLSKFQYVSNDQRMYILKNIDFKAFIILACQGFRTHV